MKTITFSLTAEELASIRSSGTSLKTYTTNELPYGTYSIIEIRRIILETPEDIQKRLKENNKDASWTSNLTQSNINGFITLENEQGEIIPVYLNNFLFNLLKKQDCFLITNEVKMGGLTEYQFDINRDKSFKFG